ncbi:MAG: ABC transporter ATP-binding protein [candidate division Zixibacteria bacterium]|nr:ABC transporter ATP-binding protein [candidate division Zixibacteria bacterium]
MGKRFGARKVFADINFSLATGDSIALTGRNGSGKTTLLMVLLALQRPSVGKIEYLKGGGTLDEDAVRLQSSLVGPYLNLYDQLTAEENLIFFSTVAGSTVPGKRINQLLERVGLEGRGNDLVRAYSSGMKQRLKYAVALLKEPAFLFLDEPSSNLDAAGKKIVAGIIEEYRSKSIVVIATNEKEEYGLARTVCALSD